jgi:LAO/AO transport system kinase
MIRALMALSVLAQRLLAGDRRALARAISLVSDDEPAGWALVAEVYPHTGSAAVVGVTGPPGAGKSTLIGALTTRRRAAGRRVGVLSIDPTSPFTGGAVLGDRIRLAEHFLDRGVFIRSMATRGALGGLADAALQATLLIDAAGHQDIYLETVGVGQGEVDVVAHADTVVLVLVPGSGDSVQALKAGVMEIPDVVVVNKAAQGPAAAMVSEIRSVLALAPAGAPEIVVLETDALEGSGIAELEDALEAQRRRIEADGTLLERRRRNLRNEVLSIAGARWRRALEARLEGDSGFDSLLDEVVARRLDPAAAARALESD